MKIEVYDNATSVPIGDVEMTVAPQIGSKLTFAQGEGPGSSYIVKTVEHIFVTSTVGDVVKDFETKHVAVICLVDPC